MVPPPQGPWGRRAMLGSRAMTHASQHVGAIEVTAIVDADIEEAPIVEAFPDIPADLLLAERATYPGVYTDDDRWRLRVRAWLIRHPEGLLLMDTGIGGPTSPSQGWAPFPGVLPDRLADLGVAPHHIDTVVISHVHDDHLGGVLADDGSPRYPNARHLVQQADVAWQHDLARESEADAEIAALLDELEVNDILDVVDGNRTLTPHLELQLLPGHTPGHQILRVTGDGSRLIVSADAWNHPAQFAHPDWPSGPDYHHAQAAASRRSLLVEILSHPGTLLAPTHLAEAFGTVGSGPDGLARWLPI
jgi:glyoxylase-like metal-dependent hydrolase (beta-lactamase superfamily II)